MAENIKQLNEITKIQCSDGNWNYDPYMHGMANGLILACALMNDVDPIFKNAPARFLSETAYRKDVDTVADCNCKSGDGCNICGGKK